ncbi:MAG: hypothetical protein ACLQKA_06075 [Bryobacteraceae bacterium]
MNAQQKRAWFVLAVFGITLLVFGAAGLIWGFHPGTFGALGLFGFSGLTPLIARKELTDERDHAIAKRATAIAFGAFWLLFVAGLMLPFFFKGPQTMIAISALDLSMIVLAAGILVFAIQAVAVLVSYRDGQHGE